MPNATNLSSEALTLATAIARTRNTRVLGYLVKALITRRNDLRDESERTVMVAADAGITEQKVLDRLDGLLHGIQCLTSRKDVSFLCAAAINQRKAGRKAR